MMSIPIQLCRPFQFCIPFQPCTRSFNCARAFGGGGYRLGEGSSMLPNLDCQQCASPPDHRTVAAEGGGTGGFREGRLILPPLIAPLAFVSRSQEPVSSPPNGFCAPPFSSCAVPRVNQCGGHRIGHAAAPPPLRRAVVGDAPQLRVCVRLPPRGRPVLPGPPPPPPSTPPPPEATAPHRDPAPPGSRERPHRRVMRRVMVDAKGYARDLPPGRGRPAPSSSRRSTTRSRRWWPGASSSPLSSPPGGPLQPRPPPHGAESALVLLNLHTWLKDYNSSVQPHPPALISYLKEVQRF